jgi:diacylglycerol kinase (ATP)
MTDSKAISVEMQGAASSTTKPALVMVEGTSVPVLVFLNSGSGGRQGGRLLKIFQKWLGEAQVYDLANVKKGGPKPEEILRKFEGVPNLRIVACGGDGTCCWLLTALEKVPGCKAPLGTMPLGTGNDFSRALGCAAPLTRVLRARV